MGAWHGDLAYLKVQQSFLEEDTRAKIKRITFHSEKRLEDKNSLDRKNGTFKKAQCEDEN